MRKWILVPVIAGGILLAGVRGVKADEANRYLPMVERLAERFGLNKDEVQNTFQEMHQERLGQMNINFEDRLNEAVSGGKITEEQKQAIEAKYKEMQQERKENRQAHQGEMESWAEENGINLEDIRGLMGGPGGRRSGFGGGMKVN